MLHLSNSHKEELYNIIVEINGDNFIETFIETGFDVFEDVAGYETVEEDALVSLLTHIHSNHTGKNDNKNVV